MTKKKWPTVGKGQRHIVFIQTTPDVRLELSGVLVPDAVGEKIFDMLMQCQTKAPPKPIALGAKEVPSMARARGSRTARKTALAADAPPAASACPADCACLCHTDVDDPGPHHLPTCAWADPEYYDELP